MLLQACRKLLRMPQRPRLYRNSSNDNQESTSSRALVREPYDITSPMKKVVLPNYQSKSGQALTKDEEERLIKYCLTHKDVERTDALLVLLFFGLRKSELKSLRIIDNKWLECETSKERLGQNVVLRKIPFTPAA